MVARALEEGQGTWQGPRTAAVLRAVAGDLFALRSRDFRYSLRVLNDHQINALALPGGHLYLCRGLIAHAASVDEVAAVVAHEMGHMEDKDFRRTVGRQLLWASMAGLLHSHDEDAAANLAVVASLLSSLRHSRRQEAQADAEAVRLALLAGYDPAGLGEFLRRLRPGPSSWLAQLFLTHPEPQRRLEWAQERTAQWLRDQPLAAYRLCLALKARGRPALALDLAHGCARWPSHRWWADTVAPELEPQVAELAALELPAEALGPVPKELVKALDDLSGDRRIHRALQVAQALDPEVGQLRYSVALSATVLALLRLQSALSEGYEVAHRLGLASSELGSLSETSRAATEEVRRARRAGWALAGVLAEVAASGPGEPLGRLTSAHMAVIMSQIGWAAAQVEKTHRSLDQLLQAATTHLVERRCSRLEKALAANPQSGELLKWFARVDVQTVAVTSPTPSSEVRTGARAQAARDALALVAGWRRALQEQGGSDNNSTRAEDIYLVSGLAYRQAALEIRLAQRRRRAEPATCATGSCQTYTATCPH
ncbi:MAG: M48 family metallopeptidase [Armatimonadetes bacterium]|nr:M48 family metallopeptidase [Armatimonadota bacterium]